MCEQEQKKLDEKTKRIKLYIHPNSLFKRIWSVILIFLMLYVATVMPYNLAFQATDVGTFWNTLELVVDFSFLFDCLTNCVSAYYNEEGELITNNRIIIINYLKGWFVIDAVASFPFNFIEDHLYEEAASSHTDYNKILRLLRLPRLYRLLKITRLFKVISFVKRSHWVMKLQDLF